MDLYRHSKKVASILHSWGMPIGLKKLEPLRPKVEVVAKAFIRGVFDTDGSVYREYGPYAQIQFKTVSHSLMSFIREHLIARGVPSDSPSTRRNKVQVFVVPPN